MKNQKIQQNNKGTSKNNPDKEAELKKKAVSKEQIAELMKEKKKMQEKKGGFIKNMWCGDLQCELDMKEKAGISYR